ncbi:hypothetical protein Nepgr_005811 [Nepenthes gracilis]|uniref:VAN3-binding protein n=1 Tax=Nepenthes gracilis TaxID=150966 RepID=A0AAD3XGT0_NEPGR|nr:hypothetical protein Nepgr_005811 [Nepenthes gracilis]
MDTDFMAATVSEAHPETMDFLSHAWCNFAVRAFQPEKLQDQSIIPTKSFYNITKSPILMENHIKMEDADMKSLPPLQSNDLKSWIWMQQAMHPELNYNGFFQKKWLPWKTMPLKNLWSIKKWAKEMKEKRKEGKRMQRAEVHAAISIAGLAAALAAIAAEKSKGQEQNNNSKEIAVASAAALVAAQCAQVAESMGAERQQLSSTIGSAMTGTSTTDILTLTAAATTSLRGAAILKARSGCRNRLNESALVQPFEDSNDNSSNFEKCRSVLAKSVKLTIETSEGKRMVRLASLHQNKEAKVILKIRKVNLLNVITGKEKCVVLDLHAELYRSTQDNGIETCYQIVLTTTRGIIKLDMGDDHQRYKMWSTTIHHMLLLSKSLTTYELQFSKY